MDQVLQFLNAHREALALFVLAVIATMREELPSPLNRVAVFVWFYAWIHDALKTFMNFHNLKTPTEKS